MPIIKSKRFILRHFKKEDEKYLTKYANDRLVSRYISTMPYPYTIKDAKKWINHCIAAYKKRKKKEMNFVIEINGHLAGAVGLSHIDKHKAEIGYWLGRDFWNKGIATEAVKVITNFGFNKLKLKRIYAYIFKQNKGSVRVLEKNGYKFEGLLRKHANKDGKLIDSLLYARVR
ncbi:GNAT family N-acetyltransferase [Candidatus Woesearchaeota archaeon]|nr:GNAT family N-acetyltransferase [Candidatus Woesearchaeota archaeon]